MKATKITLIIILAIVAIASPQIVSHSVVPQVVTPVSSAPVEIKPLVLDAAQIAVKVNDYRISKGLAPLVTNEQLNASACAKADDMIANQYWSHNSPTGITPWYFFDQAGYNYRSAGENLAYNYPSETALVTGWINSPGHEANMVGNYAEQGMCARSAMFMGQQTVIVVNHFGLR